ncbi:MAG: shikimate kinase, partial [Mycobacteriales bacterium]
MTPLTHPIVVTGLMGAGKTSVAAALGQRLGCPVHDSDADIERGHGRTAREIKDENGRAFLHEIEAEHVLAALAARPYGVVAAAASVVDRADCRAALAPAFVVWLSIEPAVLAARFATAKHRPQFDPSVLTMLEDQLRKRRKRFEALADLIVTSPASTADQVAAQILGALPGAAA